MIIVMMGVAGSGKTFVGQRLAARLGWEFVDADDVHPAANIEKMAAGVALDDLDRQPWLARLQSILSAFDREGRSVVLACSALREEFRDALRAAAADVRFVYLKGDPALIEHRLRTRTGHFMPPELLNSQLATLEEPEDALTVDAGADVEVIIDRVSATLS
jgi:gluconokinase